MELSVCVCACARARARRASKRGLPESMLQALGTVLVQGVGGGETLRNEKYAVVIDITLSAATFVPLGLCRSLG
jgi:hypothetical protein